MNLRFAIGLALGTLTITSPVLAATGNGYYTPPKIKVRGNATVPIAGAGVVVVQVFVKKNGEPTAFKIVTSTNHADDAAALAVAKSSTYTPANRDAVPLDAFYDYTLRFTGNAVAFAGAATGAGAVAKYKLMISSGNYSGAQAGLKSYLETNPNDAAAQLQLGIADQYLNDPVSAAAAFDKAGTIPQNDVAVAVRSYNDAAAASYKNKDYPTAIAYAKKAVALAPSATTFNSLGTAEDAAGQSDAAIADLQNARKLADTDAAFKASQKATIEDNLVSAYVNAGKIDDAKVAVAEAIKLNPDNTNAQAFLSQYYVRQANADETKQNYADEAAQYESAAASSPSTQQPDYYARAALSYLKIKSPTPFDKAKADADKALAIAPDNALANYAAGYALANQPGKSKDALVYLNKADAAAKVGNDTQLTTAIENAIKQLSQANN